MLALPHVERQGALRHQREVVAAVVELRVGELLALMDGLHRVVEREPVLEECQRVGITGGLVGSAEHSRDQGRRVLSARADQDVSGAERVPGLHPVDPGNVAEQGVPAGHRAGVIPAVERGARRVHDPGEERVAQQDRGEGDEIVCARVVVGIVEADRVGVAGVGEAEPLGGLVHLGDERRNRAGDSHRQGLRRVARARQEQPVEKVPDPHPLPRAQAELDLGRGLRVIGRRRDHLIRLQVVEREVGRHQLGRAGDRQPLVGGLGGQDRVIARVDQDPRLRVEPRRAGRCRRLGRLLLLRRCRARRHRRHRERDDERKGHAHDSPTPPAVDSEHGQRNAIRWPSRRVCGSRSGLSC